MEETKAHAAYLEVTQQAGRAFVMRGISGSVVMLNLLRFRKQADYSATPHLAPAQPISGAAAYQRYMEHTLPHLEASGGKVLFFGTGGPFLIGPEHERWDAAMLVRQNSVVDFLAFNSTQSTSQGWGTGSPPSKIPVCFRSSKRKLSPPRIAASSSSTRTRPRSALGYPCCRGHVRGASQGCRRAPAILSDR
jgi:hypothetical protein